jgi:hypothetical protein
MVPGLILVTIPEEAQVRQVEQVIGFKDQLVRPFPQIAPEPFCDRYSKTLLGPVQEPRGKHGFGRFLQNVLP